MNTLVKVEYFKVDKHFWQKILCSDIEDWALCLNFTFAKFKLDKENLDYKVDILKIRTGTWMSTTQVNFCQNKAQLSYQPLKFWP